MSRFASGKTARVRRVAMLALCPFALLVLGCPSSEEPPPAGEISVPLGLDQARLWNYLNTGDPDRHQAIGQQAPDPFYASWPLFPGPPENPNEFADLRLGLPTHGRWVTVYTDPATQEVVRSYLDGVTRWHGVIPPADLPDGATIVKVNYPNVNQPGVIARAPSPAVITVLYKPGPDPETGETICQTGVLYDGVHCLGNGWLWAFYGLDDPAHGLDREVFDQFVGENPQAFCVNCHDPGFQTDYVRSLERLARTASHHQTPTERPASPGPIEDSDPLCEQLPALGSEIPKDVAGDPTSWPMDQRQRLFNCFAWRAFVALNYPVSSERRGQPDTQAGLRGRPDADRVWESYKGTWELFQPEQPDWNPTDPANPASQWNTPRPLPPGCPANTELPVIHMLSKSNSRFFDQDDVANESGQAFAGTFGTLTDRNGVLVRYQVLFNETEFDFLRDSAITRQLTPAGPNGGSGVFFPDGAIEVKASWKELCPTEGCQPIDDAEDYYHRDVLVFDAEHHTCERRLLGLTGLHVVAKTFWAPQWIWATFEHESNAPLAGTDQVDQDGWSFWDPTRKPEPQPKNTFFKACSAQPFLAPKGMGDPNCPNAELNRWGVPSGRSEPIGFGDLPNQISRLQPIRDSDLNPMFQKALAGTPWEHYLLVSTQWPLNGRRPAPTGEPLPVNRRLCADQHDLSGDPLRPRATERPTDCYTMVPAFLRNTSMESYMQNYFTDDQGQVVQLSNRSCMGCHASGTDFSYVWIDAVEQIVPLPPPPAD